LISIMFKMTKILYFLDTLFVVLRKPFLVNH